jgi:hypothetical protein
MAMVITTRDGKPRIKPFTWSYTRLKNFETCPKRHFEMDINPAKPYKEPDDPGGPLMWGNYVHEKLAARCGPKRETLPVELWGYEDWCLKVIGDASPSDIEVEQNMALTEDFGPCGFFDQNTWYRAKIDLIKLQGPVALLVDWKTGKILEDSFQLALSAACVFAKYPSVQAVRCAFIWLKEDAESSENFLRSDMPKMWRTLWPRIEALKAAHLGQNYPPVPSRMCRAWCAVKACPNNGKTFP